MKIKIKYEKSSYVIGLNMKRRVMFVIGFQFWYPERNHGKYNHLRQSLYL